MPTIDPDGNSKGFSGLDYLVKGPSLTSMAETATDLGFIEPLNAVNFLAGTENWGGRRFHRKEYNDFRDTFNPIAVDRSGPKDSGNSSRFLLNLPDSCAFPAFVANIHVPATRCLSNS